MTNPVCKPLADHLAERTARGLVDIKFYVHNQSEATAAKVREEARAIFEAVERGAVEDFNFNDRHPMKA